MAVALAAAFVASRRSSDILPMVAASFSIAASAFVPVMVLGIFWRGTNRMGAVAGMLSGLGVTLYYMLSHTALAQRCSRKPGWPMDVVGYPAGVGRRVWRAGGFGGGDSGQLLEKTLATRLGLPRRLGNLLEGGWCYWSSRPPSATSFGCPKGAHFRGGQAVRMRSCGSWVSNRICGWANGSLRASSSLAICGWCGCCGSAQHHGGGFIVERNKHPGGYMPTLCSKASPAF